MTRAHPVSVVSSFRKDDNPLAVLYQSDDVPDGIPACQRPFAVQRDTPKAAHKPSGQRMDEQLVFRDVIQGPGACQAQERDILPALVLARAAQDGPLGERRSTPSTTTLKKGAKGDFRCCPGEMIQEVD